MPFSIQEQLFEEYKAKYPIPQIGDIYGFRNREV